MITLKIYYKMEGRGIEEVEGTFDNLNTVAAARTWFNRSDRFINIGNLILNTHEIIKMELVKENEDISF